LNIEDSVPPRGRVMKQPWLKIYVKIYKTMIMGQVFQAEWWEKHPSRCSFQLLWLRKLAKAMANALERKNGILAHFFMKIMEIRRK